MSIQLITFTDDFRHRDNFSQARKKDHETKRVKDQAQNTLYPYSSRRKSQRRREIQDAKEDDKAFLVLPLK